MDDLVHTRNATPSGILTKKTLELKFGYAYVITM